ncbi:hypothetical protein B0H10DRAFT_1943427 [Mycena sp. CBHHK59/15]|nr:hypothetical protein B0H10DRAFT_1943427 [Mycena sp. CBHHK59/15]
MAKSAPLLIIRIARRFLPTNCPPPATPAPGGAIYVPAYAAGVRPSQSMPSGTRFELKAPTAMRAHLKPTESRTQCNGVEILYWRRIEGMGHARRGRQEDAATRVRRCGCKLAPQIVAGVDMRGHGAGRGVVEVCQVLLSWRGHRGWRGINATSRNEAAGMGAADGACSERQRSEAARGVDAVKLKPGERSLGGLPMVLVSLIGPAVVWMHAETALEGGEAGNGGWGCGSLKRVQQAPNELSRGVARGASVRRSCAGRAGAARAMQQAAVGTGKLAAVGADKQAVQAGGRWREKRVMRVVQARRMMQVVWAGWVADDGESHVEQMWEVGRQKVGTRGVGGDGVHSSGRANGGVEDRGDSMARRQGPQHRGVQRGGFACGAAYSAVPSHSTGTLARGPAINALSGMRARAQRNIVQRVWQWRVRPGVVLKHKRAAITILHAINYYIKKNHRKADAHVLQDVVEVVPPEMVGESQRSCCAAAARARTCARRETTPQHAQREQQGSCASSGGAQTPTGSREPIGGWRGGATTMRARTSGLHAKPASTGEAKRSERRAHSPTGGHLRGDATARWGRCKIDLTLPTTSAGQSEPDTFAAARQCADLGRGTEPARLECE